MGAAVILRCHWPSLMVIPWGFTHYVIFLPLLPVSVKLTASPWPRPGGPLSRSSTCCTTRRTAATATRPPGTSSRGQWDHSFNVHTLLVTMCSPFVLYTQIEHAHTQIVCAQITRRLAVRHELYELRVDCDGKAQYGVRALSLTRATIARVAVCWLGRTTAHPLHTRFTNVFGISMYDTTMRPKYRCTMRYRWES